MHLYYFVKIQLHWLEIRYRNLKLNLKHIQSSLLFLIVIQVQAFCIRELVGYWRLFSQFYAKISILKILKYSHIECFIFISFFLIISELLTGIFVYCPGSKILHLTCKHLPSFLLLQIRNSIKKKPSPKSTDLTTFET